MGAGVRGVGAAGVCGLGCGLRCRREPRIRIMVECWVSDWPGLRSTSVAVLVPCRMASYTAREASRHLGWQQGGLSLCL